MSFPSRLMCGLKNILIGNTLTQHDGMQGLEPRTYAAADLTAAMVSPAAGTTTPVLAYGIEHRGLISVTNTGDSTPRDLRVGLSLYASADETLDPSGDLLLGSRTMSRMEAGESETEDIEFVIPRDLSGTYRIYAVIDGANEVAESNESNNTSAGVQVIFGSSSGGGGGTGGGGGGGGGGGSTLPDLRAVVTTPSSGAALAYGLEQRSLISITNTGSSTPSDRRIGLALYASLDSTLDPTGDILLGSRTISSMSGGETELEDIEFVVPRTLSGNYRIYAVVDGANEVSESNESNNISDGVQVTLGDSTGGGTGGGGGGGSTTPDLSVRLVSPANSTIAPVLSQGVQHRSLITVTNTGSSTPADLRIGLSLFASSDETLNPTGDVLLGSRTISSMSGGESETEDIEFVLPRNLSGTYRLYALVDGTNQVIESNESNNISDGVLVTFAAASTGGGTGGTGGTGGGVSTSTTPDLTTRILSPLPLGASLPVMAHGLEQRVMIMVANGGTSTPSGQRIGLSLYASSDETLDAAGDILLGSRTISSLSAGQGESEDIEFVLPSGLTGSYRIYSVVDGANQVTESNESNNTSAGVTIMFGTVDGGGGGSGGGSGGSGGSGGGGGGNDDGPLHDLYDDSRDSQDDSNSRLDVAGIVRSTKVTSETVQGKTLSGSVRYEISNSGEDRFAKNSKTTVRAYIRPIGVTDASQDIPVSSSIRETLSSLDIGQSRARNMKITMPKNLGVGEYQVILKLDDSRTLSEVNERNNIITTGRTVKINPPAVDLTLGGAVLSTNTSSSRGTTLRAQVSINNIGNTALKSAPVTITYSLVDEDGNKVSNDVTLSKKMSISAGKNTKASRISFTMPSGSGTYRIIATVSSPSDTNTQNNTVTVGSFVR